ncbi:Protein of uncharacterised function (DUF3363) [Salmonella enterica subsp. enterica]|uniref:Protein of uncharacterized function (DUF3363) n=1 Tax=Salmonella enterica I TaxID=59201 RepID=A0A379W2X8_SALET|nr:Protein of uncharacterised function (DUF3363) [Salmonella enterica subsp. enterica]
MQRAMRGEPRELAVFEPGDDGRTILGRVAAKGLADELRDRGYLVIDGVTARPITSRSTPTMSWRTTRLVP